MAESPSVNQLLESLDEETAEAVVIDLISAALFARDLELTDDLLHDEREVPVELIPLYDQLLAKYVKMGLLTEEHGIKDLRVVLAGLTHATREAALAVLLGEDV